MTRSKRESSREHVEKYIKELNTLHYLVQFFGSRHRIRKYSVMNTFAPYFVCLAVLMPVFVLGSPEGMTIHFFMIFN